MSSTNAPLVPSSSPTCSLESQLSPAGPLPPTGMPQPPAELKKHLCPGTTTFFEVLNPTEWKGEMGGSKPWLSQRARPPNEQRFCTNWGKTGLFLLLLSMQAVMQGKEL